MSPSLIAAALTLLAQTSAPTVEEVRATARGMLQSLCGAQCDVIAVEIKTKPVERGGVAPGFDDPPAVPRVAAAIDLKLLLDKDLPTTFRDFVKERVRHRIGEFGLPVTVSVDAVPFPERPSPPESALPTPTQTPSIIIQAPAPAPPATVAPDPAVEEALARRLIEAVPVILLALLLALLVIHVLRRLEAMNNLAFAPAVEEPPKAVEAPPPQAVPTAPAAPSPVVPDAGAVASAFAANRSAARRVMRRLLVSGEYELAAGAVRLFGPQVVGDLMHDPEVRAPLTILGERAAELLREPSDEAKRSEILARLDAELLGERVASGNDVRPELENLLAFGPEAFSAFVTGVGDKLRVVALRHAPAHLVKAYFDGLDAGARSSALDQLLRLPPATPEDINALVRAIHDDADAARIDGEESGRIMELLEALSSVEQEFLVETLAKTRPDFVRRNLAQLPVESALLRVPAHALASAWGSVPVDAWVAYLRGAPDAIRSRALLACPARLRESVDEELGLRVAADVAKASDARRRIVRAALAAAPHAVGHLSGEDREVAEIRDGRRVG